MNSNISYNNRRFLKTRYVFEHRLFKVLVGIFVFSICVYVYSLSSVIYGIVERRNLEKHVSVLKSDIAGVEKDYLDKIQSLTIEYAINEGYHKPLNKYYENQERMAFITGENQEQGF